MSGPRILAIMGSGETAPTMAKVHRALFERLGPAPVPAAIIDTPYGFQENADDLSERTIRFFGESVGREVVVASYRSRDVDAVSEATAVARIREARYLMAGPGSPSYALRQWADGPIPDALAHGLRDGGILTMASAAALTLGTLAIPVYEIYKVGEDPHWLRGARPPWPGDRLAGGDRAPLRQRRGREPRHAVLLYGRTTAPDARSADARGCVRGRGGQPHGARPRPGSRDRIGHRPRRGDGPRRRSRHGPPERKRSRHRDRR